MTTIQNAKYPICERVQRMQEDIQRGENNIVALRREIASLRQ